MGGYSNLEETIPVYTMEQANSLIPCIEDFNIEYLRMHREAQGRTITFMAKKLGYKSPSGYANIESGRNALKFTDAVRISQILGIDLYTLFFTKPYSL